MFRRVSIRLALLSGDSIIVLLALYLASWLRPQLWFGRPIPLAFVQLEWYVYGLAAGVWLTSFLLLDVYNLKRNLRIIDELQRVVAAHVASSLAFAGVLYFSFRDVSRLQVISFGLISLLLLLAYRLVFRSLLRFFGHRRYGSRRILIVGAGSLGQDIAKMVIEHSWTGLSLVGFVDDDAERGTMDYPHFGTLKQTIRIVREERINEVIFALPRDAHLKLADLVFALQSLKVNVRVVPDFFDLVFVRSAVEEFGGMPLVTLREPVLDPFQRLTKRMFDLIVGSISLVLAMPFMAMIALAIKLDSPGPAIFKQQRVGEHGKLFDMYKFRTMIHDPAAYTRQRQIITEAQPVHKFYDDPRVTRTGRFLRRLSLDELPQLVNVLKGDMSLVGPRPELPWLVERYEPWQRKRFEVPQGLTGWWQINGRADKPMHLHTEEDLYYIKHYSLWLDIQVLWRTIKAVLDRRGAY